jgi:hypothetical protein
MTNEAQVPDQGHGIHDIGGLPFGPVDRAEHPLTDYDKRVEAMQRLLSHPKRAISRADALRRAIEDLSQEEYDRLEYSDRWIRAIRTVLVEQQVLSEEEINERMAAIRAGKERRVKPD